MWEKAYLYLFILVTILPQGIFGLEDDIGESSNVLVRKKRVISRIPEEDVPEDVGNIPYIVNLKKNRHMHCLGTVLSHFTVITAARCVTLDLRNYEVFAGSTVSTKGKCHNVTHRAMLGHNPSRSSTFLTGIALITVSPSFQYKSTLFPISLHTEPVIIGMTGIISGWGSFAYGGRSESTCPIRLRSITVPIMDHQHCRNIYRNHFPITEEDFCTFDAQRLCGYTDIGAPFVINRTLVGVHIGGIDAGGLPITPDVFALVQHTTYSQWINRNIVH